MNCLPIKKLLKKKTPKNFLTLQGVFHYIFYEKVESRIIQTIGYPFYRATLKTQYLSVDPETLRTYPQRLDFAFYY
jgi:hypothetical protein